jgi:hypothetical protein
MQKEYLYLLECEQYYKIGISNNPKIRFTSIRTANPFEVKPVMCIFTYDRKKTKQLESMLHSRFKRMQHRNEWFTKSFEIVNLIKSKVDNKEIFLFEDFESMYYGVHSSPLNTNISNI